MSLRYLAALVFAASCVVLMREELLQIDEIKKCKYYLIIILSGNNLLLKGATESR
jgi:hypothetical protein